MTDEVAVEPPVEIDHTLTIERLTAQYVMEWREVQYSQEHTAEPEMLWMLDTFYKSAPPRIYYTYQAMRHDPAEIGDPGPVWYNYMWKQWHPLTDTECATMILTHLQKKWKAMDEETGEPVSMHIAVLPSGYLATILWAHHDGTIPCAVGQGDTWMEAVTRAALHYAHPDEEWGGEREAEAYADVEAEFIP